jgi:heme/copper-type cytochrome/quinol oxidase subunit 4
MVPPHLLAVATPVIGQSAAAVTFFFLLGLVFIAVYFAMTLWVYTDAQQKSTHPPFLWALVVFLAALPGLLLYLLVGRNQTHGRRTY